MSAAVEQAVDVESISSLLGGEQLREFLRSAEVHNVVRQIFASVNPVEIDEVETQFCELWRKRAGGASYADPEVTRLFRSLVALCQKSLDRAIAQGNLTALEARSAQRHAELRGTIETLSRSLSMFESATGLDIAAIDDYANKYRRQLVVREGTITPPALDSARQVPIDSLYVPGRLEAPEGHVEPIDYAEFGRSLFRRVVLGNPGSGKSTLAKKLAADLARDRLHLDHRPSGLVPFLVVLRDFGAHKRDDRCSIVDFLTAISNSHYQLPAPEGAIEYLLLTGRAMVIFDGLDELLDTSYRAEISADVESFANLYPAVPILVTSREVGYQQAPLSPETFSVFRLAPFSDPQIQQYARNWFALDKGKSDPDVQANAFMKDSATVYDLRSNALMLGLMCNLYKGAGYIPRNRPDVYEACAVMLFDRWDRLRQIGKPLKIESLLRPAMQHLAAWIYSDGELQSGVTEKDLIATTSSFLLNRRFEHQEDAELEATRFIELCRGRAWVFTDTGTTSSGERLYQFTHRTFLEFFTAGHLVRTNATPEELLKVLTSHISEREWDVVAQLSFQLLDNNVDGAADILLLSLVPGVVDIEDEAKANRLDFAVRSLEFLVPSPVVTKSLAVKAVDWLMQSAARGLGVDSNLDETPDESRADTVLVLLGANPENVQPIRDALVDRLGSYLYDQSASIYASELILNLTLGARRQNFRESESLADGITQSLLGEHRDALQEAAKADYRIATDLITHNALNAGEFLASHGPEPFFHERAYVLFPTTRRVPLAEIVVASLLWKYPGGLAEKTYREVLTVLARYLPPANHLERAATNGSWLASFSPKQGQREVAMDDLSGDQAYAVLMLLAIFFEDSIDGERGMDNLGGSRLAGLARTVLLTRKDGDRASAEVALKNIDFSQEQREMLLAWIQKKISLAPRQKIGWRS